MNPGLESWVEKLVLNLDRVQVVGRLMLIDRLIQHHLFGSRKMLRQPVSLFLRGDYLSFVDLLE